jgi:hypothetical protein
MQQKTNLAEGPGATMPDFSEYETVEGLAEVSKGKITTSQIRWALRFREKNGLSEAVVKFGKTIYIHVPTFMRIAFHR